MENEKTDLQRFVELYKSFGIECKVNIAKADGQTIGINKYDHYIVMGDDYADGVTESESFNGYPSFYSDVVFDKHGKFKSQGFWE